MMNAHVRGYLDLLLSMPKLMDTFVHVISRCGHRKDQQLVRDLPFDPESFLGSDSLGLACSFQEDPREYF